MPLRMSWVGVAALGCGLGCGLGGGLGCGLGGSGRSEATTAASPASAGSVAPASLASTPATAPVAKSSAPVEAAPSGALATVGWLVGAWAGTTQDGGTVEETWTVEGAALKGAGRTVGKDGKERGETLRIEARDGAIVYVAQPGGAAPTDFVLDPRTSGAAHAQFVDETHDWPTRIRYERTGEALKVRLRGRPGQPDETFTLQKK